MKEKKYLPTLSNILTHLLWDYKISPLVYTEFKSDTSKAGAEWYRNHVSGKKHHRDGSMSVYILMVYRAGLLVSDLLNKVKTALNWDCQLCRWYSWRVNPQQQSLLIISQFWNGLDAHPSEKPPQTHTHTHFVIPKSLRFKFCCLQNKQTNTTLEVIPISRYQPITIFSCIWHASKKDIHFLFLGRQNEESNIFSELWPHRAETEPNLQITPHSLSCSAKSWNYSHCWSLNSMDRYRILKKS